MSGRRLTAIWFAVSTLSGLVAVNAVAGDGLYYKEVDGILIAHRIEALEGEESIEVIHSTIEHNVDMPGDRFDLPAEIAELLD